MEVSGHLVNAEVTEELALLSEVDGFHDFSHVVVVALIGGVSGSVLG